MDTIKYIFSGLAIIFLVGAAIGAVSKTSSKIQTRVWLTAGLIFALISCFLWLR